MKTDMNWAADWLKKPSQEIETGSTVEPLFLLVKLSRLQNVNDHKIFETWCVVAAQPVCVWRHREWSQLPFFPSPKDDETTVRFY